MAEDLPLSVDRLPTLTEVLELGRDLPSAFWHATTTEGFRYGPPAAPQPPVVDMVLEALPAAFADTPATRHLDDSVIVERVLAELEPRIARLLEDRLREALAPALARAADALIRETRVELAAATRALVEESLAQVLRQPHQG